MYAASHAALHPDQPALVLAPSGEIVTYAQYEAAANRWAQVFRSSGLVGGDHVAFLMENTARILECQGGAERTGLYFTLVNSYLSPEEAGYIFDDCQARIVVTSGAKLALAAACVEVCRRVERWIVVGATGEVPAPWERAEDLLAGVPSTPVADEELGCAMLYSSGTTGRPKGIQRPMPRGPVNEWPGLMAGPKALWNMHEAMVYLSPAPLYHSAPQMSIAISIRLGATVVVMERFDAAMFLDLVGEHRVTHTQMVPTMFSRLLKLPGEVRERADVSSMEVIIHAAAPCPVPVKEDMIAWFGPILIEYYAATEGHGMTFIDSKDWLQHRGSVGRCLGSEMLILDDNQNPMPVGEPGTVWFRGSTNFQYFNDPAKTAESREQTDTGLMSTVGDVGYVDEDGYLFLTDRKTYMIISGGVNIYPQETENLLITHPKVMDAAVLGVPDDDLGEVVKAVVQPVPGVSPGPELEQELIAFCREHLARFKVPRSVDFEEELPRLPTGKLYKRLLRDRYWKDHDTRIL
jgi:long-chain acyl-CoA synthetase